ncbi:MAG: nodulation protein NodJ, partial [Pseudomonadota bacterium]
MANTPSPWKELFKPPQISLRWLPVFRRNLLVW